MKDEGERKHGDDEQGEEGAQGFKRGGIDDVVMGVAVRGWGA